MEKETMAVVPAEAIAKSKQNKKEKPKNTTAQLPVYQKASTLLRATIEIVRMMPRCLRKVGDQMLADASELLKSIALANEHRGEERAFYLINAIAISNAIITYYKCVHMSGAVSKDSMNKIVAVFRSVMAQFAGWRDSTIREGHNNYADRLAN